MVDGWYLHFLQTPVVISRKQWFLRMCSLKSRDFGSPRCRMRLYVIGVRCDLVGYAAFSSMICFLRNRLQKVHEYAGVLYLMWCVILRSSDMPNAWSQALLWRTHPLIKLVVTVTFVMNKVEGSWARPWLKKNIFCRVRNVTLDWQTWYVFKSWASWLIPIPYSDSFTRSGSC